MNENVSIVIQPVANGYIVQLPYDFNPYDGLKEVLPGNDPMLNRKKADGEIKKTEHVHIFFTFEQVLSFLATRYIKD